MLWKYMRRGCFSNPSCTSIPNFTQSVPTLFLYHGVNTNWNSIAKQIFLFPICKVVKG